MTKVLREVKNSLCFKLNILVSSKELPGPCLKDINVDEDKLATKDKMSTLMKDTINKKADKIFQFKF